MFLFGRIVLVQLMGHISKEISRFTLQNVSCDFDMQFAFIAASWEGIAHESRVFENAIVDLEAKFPFPPRGI